MISIFIGPGNVRDFRGISNKPSDVFIAPVVALVQSEDVIYVFGLEDEKATITLKEYLDFTDTPHSRIQLRNMRGEVSPNPS